MTRRFGILLSEDVPSTHDPWCWREDWHADGESAFALLGVVHPGVTQAGQK